MLPAGVVSREGDRVLHINTSLVSKNDLLQHSEIYRFDKTVKILKQNKK